MSDWIDQEAPRAFEQYRTRIAGSLPKPKRRSEFFDRLEPEFPTIFRNFHTLYGWRWDFAIQLEAFLEELGRTAIRRPKPLRSRDRIDVSWTHDHRTLWAMAYVDRFVGSVSALPESVEHLRRLGVTHLHLMPPYRTPPGPDDGGYAVSDYRSLDPAIGTMDDLRGAVDALDEAGIQIVLDFVANHTAFDHPWARKAMAGDPRHRDFYWIFDDREIPDRFAPHLREIFPDRPGDAFTWSSELPGDGGWVWTTFHEYQWDLDYTNPEVLTAMTGELAFIASLGPAAIRVDATPFLWKREGTDCENLPETHLVIELFASAMRVVAPSVELLSEAIVHPDDVAAFIRPEECRLGYNPLLMASLWEALATGDTRLLSVALAERSGLPSGCQWIGYLRCHDDIGWGFADEDALRFGIDPAGHRRFLNDFYSGSFPGSFAAGMVFQENPRSGDARISGTLASLAGLEAAIGAADPDLVDLAVRRILVLHAVLLTSVGIPLVFLGDEVGQLNDYGYLDDPLLEADNRWAHRPPYPWARLASAREGSGPEARVLAGILDLLETRRAMPGLLSSRPQVLTGTTPAVIAYRHDVTGAEYLTVANLGQESGGVAVDVGGGWTDPRSGEPLDPTAPLQAYGFVVAARNESGAPLSD